MAGTGVSGGWRGFHPFWFWNDRLEAGEVRRQVAEMARQGIRGFFIHSRQGLGQPYLGEAFLDMVEVAVQAAREHGLIVHLYDEYPYPSGSAGGLVTMGCPQFHYTELRHERMECPGGPFRWELPPGKVLAATAFPSPGGQVQWDRPVDLSRTVGVLQTAAVYLDQGLTRYNRKRFFSGSPVPVMEAALEGPHRIVASLQTAPRHMKYFGHNIDTLNPQAVRRFMELTHERYRQRLGGHFGAAIASIFTDEAAPDWSDRLGGELERQLGDGLWRIMPALAEPSHPRHAQAAWALQQLRLRWFAEAWEEPIGRWCRGAHLAYCGEKPSLRLSQLRYMDVPGCEPGHVKAGRPLDVLGASIRGNARATASAAYFYGKAGSLCECYHSLGWGATLQDAKYLAEGLLLAGVEMLVPHGFFYSTHGLRKHDAPPSFFFQMPFWPMWGRLSRRVDRILEQFAGTRIDAEILLIDCRAGWATAAQQQAWSGIQQSLMAAHLDYLVADTDVLEASSLVPGGVRAAGVVAKAVLLPPMTLLEPPLEAWLGRFERSGGAVVRCGDDWTPARLLRDLGRHVQPHLRIGRHGEPAAAVWSVTRSGPEGPRWLVLNTSSEPIDVELDAGRPLREIPLDEGLPPMLRLESGAYRRRFAPFESTLLAGSEERQPPPVPPIARMRVGGPAIVRPLNKNLLRMHRWRMTLPQEGQAEQSATVSAMPLVDQLDHGGFRIRPRFVRHFGAQPELALGEMEVRYEHAFDCRYGGKVELVMEPDSLAGDWQVRVNGSPPIRPRDFASTEAHVRGSLGVDITAWVRRGHNRIVVLLGARRLDDGLLSSLYLAGGFGVRLGQGAVLEDRPEQGRFECYEDNGLPYYAGSIEYDLSCRVSGDAPAGAREPQPRASLPGGPVMVELEFERPFHEAAEVWLNGVHLGVSLWQRRLLRIPPGVIRAGTNDLRIRVHTTLIRSFEGQRFDEQRHVYCAVEEAIEPPPSGGRPASGG